MLQSGKQNQRCPTSVLGGYITSAAWGVPNASAGGKLACARGGGGVVRAPFLDPPLLGSREGDPPTG